MEEMAAHQIPGLDDHKLVGVAWTNLRDGLRYGDGAVALRRRRGHSFNDPRVDSDAGPRSVRALQLRSTEAPILHYRVPTSNALSR